MSCAFDNPNDYYDQEIGFNIAPFGTELTLDILTWNLQNFPKEYSTTTDYLSQIIYELDVDILALQEIESSSYFYQLIDEINKIDSLNNWTGYHSPSGGGWNLSYLYNPSEIEILSIFEIYNDNSWAFPRPPLVLKIEYNSETIHIINNHFKAYSGSENEERRREACQLLQSYIDSTLPNENVILLGDLNDEIQEPEELNVFWNFVEDSENFQFADMEIAESSSANWSYPTWPSHIDHILITNELFDEFENNHSDIKTIKIDQYMESWIEYESNISDHRPVALKLKFISL